MWLPVLAQEEDEDEKEKEKPLARLAPTIAPADLVQPGKKTRLPSVPMTDEERNKMILLKELHQSGAKELQELLETRKELQKKRDDLLFRQRCLAARLVDRIIFQRRDAAYVREELRIGLMIGDDLPEELRKARRPISLALFLYSDMGRAMQIGLDRFLVEYADVEVYKRGGGA